jgi:hypothetical protein
MRHLLNTVARRLVGSAVICVLSLTTLPATWHADDDAICGQPVGSSATETLSQPDAQPSQPHCEICHWIRSLRSAGVAELPLTLDHSARLTIVTGRVLCGSAPVVRRLPSRAPPALVQL